MEEPLSQQYCEIQSTDRISWAKIRWKSIQSEGTAFSYALKNFLKKIKCDHWITWEKELHLDGTPVPGCERKCAYPFLFPTWVLNNFYVIIHPWLTNLINILYPLIAQLVKNPPAMQETLVRFLDWEDPL